MTIKIGDEVCWKDKTVQNSTSFRIGVVYDILPANYVRIAVYNRLSDGDRKFPHEIYRAWGKNYTFSYHTVPESELDTRTFDEVWSSLKKLATEDEERLATRKKSGTNK